MDALHNFFSNGFALSPVNTALLGVIFWLAKQRYYDQQEQINKAEARLDRCEKTFYKAGIDLVEME